MLFRKHFLAFEVRRAKVDLVSIGSCVGTVRWLGVGF